MFENQINYISQTDVKPNEFYERFNDNYDIKYFRNQDKFIGFIKIIDKKYTDGINYMKKTTDYDYKIDWSDIPKEVMELYNYLRKNIGIRFFIHRDNI